MGELKPGWRRVKFGDMATHVTDRVDDPSDAGVDRYVGLEHLDADSLAIRHWASPDAVTSTKLRFRPGDIIFGKRRAYQRKLAVADFEGICSAHAMVLRAKPDVVLPEFLPFLMQSDHFMERAAAISVGSLSPTINWKTLAAEEFVLPPLAEQVRAAKTLRVAMAARHSFETAAAVVSRLRMSALMDRFGHDLSRFGPGAWLAARQRAFTQTGIWRSLTSIVDKIIDYRGKTPPYTMAGVPVVSQEDVQDAGLLPTTKWVTDETAMAWSHRGRPEAGDIVFRMERFPGAVAQLPSNRVILTRGVFGIRPRPSVVSKDYLFWYLFWLRRCEFWSLHEHATTVPRLYKSEVLAVPVMVLPHSEQAELVRTMELIAKATQAIDARQRHASATYEKAKRAMLEHTT